MKFTLKDSLEMYYEVHGSTDSEKTLVFIGGLSQSTIAWTGYLPYLKTSYRVVVLDLIFQGQSDTPAEHRSFEQHAQDVRDLMAGLSIDKANFIGISYGGAVLLRLMVNHPEIVEKGVVMASFAHKPPMFDALGLSWVRALEVGGYELMLDVMLPSVLGKSYFENPIIPIDAIKTGRKELHPSKENLMKLMQATAESGDYRPELSKVKCPTLVIVGEEDILCTPEINQAIADAIPEAQYLKIPKVGHTLNLEAIPQTLKAITEFV